VTIFEESLAVGRELGITFHTAVALTGLGATVLLMGDPKRAARLFSESLLHQQRHGTSFSYTIECLKGAAGVAMERGHVGRAARLFGAAEALRATLGASQDATFQTMQDQIAAAIRAQLDETAFAAARAEGHAMSLEQAVAYALEAVAPVAPREPGVNG
jgi:hypothetical protein